MVWLRTLAAVVPLAFALGVARADDQAERSFAGSIQLDYMAIPNEPIGRQLALDSATAEASLKVVHDFGEHLSASIKVCVACHGLEVGMAFFDLRVADELTIRVGRFTPQLGAFPLRHDPANHRTSDKPLPYDMGRMLHIADWNMSVLPSPWVDNGIEVSGTRFLSEHAQIDYAAYAVAGPRAANDAVDFEYKLSRSGEAYYVDNNSHPVYGAHASLKLTTGDQAVTVGASAMTGTYDPLNELGFTLGGAHLIVQLWRAFFRAEYLVRRTEMTLGMDPASRFKYGPGADGTYDPYFLKQGFYAEVEVPLDRRFDVIARWDGMRRQGNVVRTSALRSDSAVLRYTIGGSVLLKGTTRIKLSGELYDFSDFTDRFVIHTAIAGGL
jgi:hypothetical protein